MKRSIGRVAASGALIVGMFALTAYGQGIARRPVQLDGSDVTQMVVTPDGGATAQDIVAPGAMFYQANGTGYISGCWGHGGGIGWADELRLTNAPVGGAPLDWYSFNYAMGYGVLFGYCVPGCPECGDCDCYCPVGGGYGCNEDDPPYTLEVALYDGPPGPGATCDGGLPIAGTEATIVTDISRPLGYRSITMIVDVDPKVVVPGIVWGVVMTDQEDAWLAIGSTPHIGTSQQDGAFWNDADTDGTWDEWNCWPDPYGWTCPGCSGWMVWSAAGNAQVTFSLVPVAPPAGTKHPGTYTIEKNGATLDKGDEVVFFEIRVSSFDPKDQGTLLKAWQAGVDAAAGYASGLQGTLAPHFADCSTVDVCAEQMGRPTARPASSTRAEGITSSSARWS
jgi:hypothetical protein